MKFFKVHLLASEKIAQDTYTLKVSKPASFKFKSGQYVDLYLTSTPGSEYRTLSMANSPQDDYLLFLFRHRRQSQFKKQLLNLPPNSTLIITQAIGFFDLPKNSFPVVFLAGGVGIAPFRSMLLDSLSKEKRQIYLFYSNKSKEAAPFLEELAALAKTHALFYFQPIFSKDEGRLNIAQILELIKDQAAVHFFISGLPDMVYTLRKELFELGVPYQQVQIESFTGY